MTYNIDILGIGFFSLLQLNLFYIVGWVSYNIGISFAKRRIEAAANHEAQVEAERLECLSRPPVPGRPGEEGSENRNAIIEEMAKK